MLTANGMSDHHLPDTLDSKVIGHKEMHILKGIYATTMRLIAMATANKP